MCGIAGIINKSGVELELLKQFTDSLEHRGPDAGKYELLENNIVGLGHRRLSILDLSEKGLQPMSTDDGRYSMVYNGEVFNFMEIRADLEHKGYQFTSDTDSEVVLKAYQEWGSACLDRFNGMWAIAIWDTNEKELFLARDRFGIKPLYFSTIYDSFYFASETYAFKKLPTYNRDFDQKLLDLNKKNVFALEGSGYTVFKNILQILPGHYAVVKLNSLEVQQKRWYDIREKRQEVPSSFEEQKEKFLDLFKDACKLRLISDVPVATALSGGLDSSSVYSMVKEILSEGEGKRVNENSQRAFSAIFPGLEVNEKEYADKAAQYVNGDINYIETEEDKILSRIKSDTELADFISTAPITSISSVYKGMRDNGIIVSLDGHGVDEMLYGYRDMVSKLFYNSLQNDISKSKEYKDVLVHMYYQNQVEEKEKNFSQQINQAQKAKKSIKSVIKSLVKKPVNQKMNFNLVHDFPSLSDKPLEAIGNFEMDLLYYEFFISTLPTLLRNFDRAGMANGIEIRMPFMDYRLVEYCFSLPASSKIGKGFTKLILRESMKGKMDEDVRLRTYKVGIGSPFYHWLKGETGVWAMDTLSNGELRNRLEEARTKNEIDRNVSVDVWKELNQKLIQ